MNWYAAKALGIPFPYSEKTIVIYKKTSPKYREWVREHEVRDRSIMQKLGELTFENFSEAHLQVTVDMHDYPDLKTAMLSEARGSLH